MKGIKLGEIYLDLVEADYNGFSSRCEITFAIDKRDFRALEQGLGEYDVLSYKSTMDFYDFQERCCYRLPEIEKVIFNPPATIVLWGDGTKTVVKSNDTKTVVKGDKIYPFYNKETGLAMCIAKKALGNKGNYYNTFKKWLGE